MTDLAAQLDQKLTQLAPAKARALERLVREAIALAESADLSSPTTTMERVTESLLDLRVQPLPLANADFNRLCEAMDEPPRELPRLREVLRESSKLGNA